MATPRTAPSHLTADSARLFRRIVRDYGLADEPAALEVLRPACEALNRGAEARDRISIDGPYVANRFGVLQPHPALAVEKDSRIAALRALRELSLDPGEVLDSRPPRVGTGAMS